MSNDKTVPMLRMEFNRAADFQPQFGVHPHATEELCFRDIEPKVVFVPAVVSQN